MFLVAKLIEKDLVKVTFESKTEGDFKHAKFEIDHKETVEAKLVELKKEKGFYDAFFEIKNFELGHSYFLLIPDIGRLPLDVSKATEFEGFDRDYYCDEELGAFYSKEETLFKLWAPLASTVLIKFDDCSYSLTRGEKGLWKVLIKGDLEGKAYTYLITNNEVTVETIDVYAKASTENSSRSVVLDLEKLKTPKKNDCLKQISKEEVIIYEGDVRDMTISKHSDIKNKGQFLGLCEKGKRTAKGNPMGFDYYSSLGFTHLQLLPMNDFKTIDEVNPSKTYNWGYDPTQYFVPEGSYSSDARDPKARIVELQEMIESYHEAGIRIVEDVVFNHVYEYLSSPFEKTVPNFYFRKLKNGKMANTSWCGNDLASERPMVRKLIVDACKWWIDFYNVDGFRFDLMGILDVETIKEILNIGLRKDPSFIVYGEGWNMGGEVKVPLANMDNHGLLKDVSFFNDSFREDAKRYASGEWFARDAFKYGLTGSKGKFSSSNQSINYVECHDNHTFFDYLENKKGIKNLNDKINRSKLALAFVALSRGIPFFHMGQEIAESKFGVENSYNSGDVINKMSCTLLDERIEMVNYFKDLLSLRKTLQKYISSDFFAIDEEFEIKDVGGAAILLTLKTKNESPYEEISIFFNITDQLLSYNFETDVTLLFTNGGKGSDTNVRMNNVLVPKQSILVVAK